MIRLDRPLEPQDVLDRAEQTILKLRENPASITREERDVTIEALADVHRFAASELMRQQAMQMKQHLASL
jgi:hypothetical protein